MATNDETPTEPESESDKQVRTDGGTPSDEDDVEPVPMTFYLKPETQRSVKRWLKRLELDHREVEESLRHHQYEAIVMLAMENEEEFIQRVDDLS